MKANNHEWVVYLLRCVDDSLYCGITNDLESRLSKHNSGKGAKYTRSRLPVQSKTTKRFRGPWALVWHREVANNSASVRLERRIKKRGIGRF